MAETNLEPGQRLGVEGAGPAGLDEAEERSRRPHHSSPYFPLLPPEGGMRVAPGTCGELVQSRLGGCLQTHCSDSQKDIRPVHRGHTAREQGYWRPEVAGNSGGGG